MENGNQRLNYLRLLRGDRNLIRDIDRRPKTSGMSVRFSLAATGKPHWMN
jgi:hypothetical protein